MKRIVRLHTVLALSLISGTVVFSQENQNSSGHGKTHDYESQIRMVFGDEWMAINPEAVTSLENCFATRITYKEEVLTSDDKYPLLSSFPLMNKNNPLVTAINYADFDPETFIPITYNLPFFSETTQVIRVDGTNYVIVIDPIKYQH